MDTIKININASNTSEEEIVWELLNDRRREYPQGGITKISSGSTSEFVIWESKNSWGYYYDDGRMTIFHEDLYMHLELTF